MLKDIDIMYLQLDKPKWSNYKFIESYMEFTRFIKHKKNKKQQNMKKPFKLKHTDGKKASPAKMFNYAEQKQMLTDRDANLNQRFDDSMAEQQRQQQQQSMMGPGAMTPQEQMVQDRQDKLDEIKRSIEELSNR